MLIEKGGIKSLNKITGINKYSLLVTLNNNDLNPPPKKPNKITDGWAKIGSSLYIQETNLTTEDRYYFRAKEKKNVFYVNGFKKQAASLITDRKTSNQD